MLGKKNYARRSVRSPVTPFEIKGHLVEASGRQSDVVLIWNISDDGLCIWGTHKLKHGEKVTLSISHPWQVDMTCEVRWTRMIPDRSGVLLGLAALDHQEQLQAIHKSIIERTPKAV